MHKCTGAAGESRHWPKYGQGDRDIQQVNILVPFKIGATKHVMRHVSEALVQLATYTPINLSDKSCSHHYHAQNQCTSRDTDTECADLTGSVSRRIGTKGGCQQPGAGAVGGAAARAASHTQSRRPRS